MQDSYPEIRELIELLIEKGFKLIGYEDPDADVTLVKADIDTIVEYVQGVEEAWVELDLNGKYSGLYFVTGNEPGVALNDYTYNETNGPIIEQCSEEIYNKYNK